MRARLSAPSSSKTTAPGKVFGSGFALAVLLDATLVGMLLVPATMELSGDHTRGCPSGSSGSSKAERRGPGPRARERPRL